MSYTNLFAGDNVGIGGTNTNTVASIGATGPRSVNIASGTHVAQPLQFLMDPGATFGDLGIFSLRKPFGVADQMRQTGLTQPHPFRVNGVAVADQNALPILDQCLESLLRPMPVNHGHERG